MAAMARKQRLAERGATAACHLRTTFPGLDARSLVLGPVDAVVSYTDGPPRRTVEQALGQRYKVAHLAAAHLHLRRELSLPVVLEVLITGKFRPQTMATLCTVMKRRKAPAPGQLAVLLSGMYTSGVADTSWRALIDGYPRLCEWLSPERLDVARAVLAEPAS